MAMDEKLQLRMEGPLRRAIQEAARRDRRKETDWARLVLAAAAGYEPTGEYAEDDIPDPVEKTPRTKIRKDKDAMCAECGHVKDAHLSTAGMPDRCMECPPEDRAFHSPR